ncbi:MAG: UbiH/UbiF/VisC/COQ6 family ubiquinone biosynthesis hydroxylase [Candidatus Thiodiazotropha taylori]|nr:UbiH/UbiF/VisC/COQ6 family ubiquinone biosynthesis hydroxylase [Candidatus Thiodiazotropha taylori]MCG8026737.1 UbiH/UbiF/VisC/COQ6 family ubiquinone biosynthesis hydroxylase [Candidatus Thiodiazotropha taylori]MCG8049578.1 UbiH/UbiF/VisC/COQ6 family ubiquinone biosynthesis hydroxylase [Candidatus Thiodiazotropha taylori]MCG8105422.1 UbiH/UbiF/VisC/COQ6 family ubiquinone biosynthesis hydroxylase [Candidatus Thiodiazotropha taylori]MCG8109632.1 UbiH/UbiF/VisC/COQ6 family ubiquinone biosynthes
MTNSPSTVDLLIVGGGMVGSALACAMAEAGFEVTVIDVREPARSWPEDEVDLRVSALTRASQRILENLQAWPRMVEMRVSPYDKMEVWDAGGNGRIHFSAAEIGEMDLGHIVENRVTQLALWERLESYPNVQLRFPERISNLFLGESPEVELQSGERLTAKLVVAADGRDSEVRHLAGIDTRGWEYDQHAIVATITPKRFHENTARQRFMSSGPLALLPIDDGRCSIVWSTSPTHGESLMSLDDAGFCQALTQASEAVLGSIQATGPRGLFPLRLEHADTYIQPGLALIGDAAHAMHPLAGQGVNLGLMDAMTLADVLTEAGTAGRSIGSMATLRRYERARKGANIAMLGAMDGFKRLFSNEVPPLRVIRNLGLNLADRSGFVKHQIMRRAMGMIGDRPRLAR